jgi:hypothetical protein
MLKQLTRLKNAITGDLCESIMVDNTPHYSNCHIYDYDFIDRYEGGDYRFRTGGTTIVLYKYLFDNVSMIDEIISHIKDFDNTVLEFPERRIKSANFFAEKRQ